MELLRARDEQAFRELVERYHGALLGVAVGYVRDPGAAEDVVQETWIGLLQSLDRFQGRCALKTWLFRILFNKAQNRVARDRRLVPFSTLAGSRPSSSWNAIDPTRPSAGAEAASGGSWPQAVPAWSTDPDRALTCRRVLEAVRIAIDGLPPIQAAVIRMRDVEGFDSAEVCEVLDLSAANQRVLLHRARVRVRRAVTLAGEAPAHLAGGTGGAS